MCFCRIRHPQDGSKSPRTCRIVSSVLIGGTWATGSFDGGALERQLTPGSRDRWAAPSQLLSNPRLRWLRSAAETLLGAQAKTSKGGLSTPQNVAPQCYKPDERLLLIGSRGSTGVGILLENSALERCKLWFMQAGYMLTCCSHIQRLNCFDECPTVQVRCED
jgi:hypothetical protein